VRHPPLELERFVEAIDAAVPEPASILVIGGAAAALAYGATRERRTSKTNGRRR
jgi:hypothetical protein